MIRPGRFRFDPRQSARLVFAVLLGLVLANLVFALAVTRPRIARYEALSEDSAPSLARLKKREEAVRALEQYAATLRKTEADLDYLRREVLSTRDRRMIDIQLEVARLAEQFRVNLARIQYENEVLAEEGLERFAMTVPLQGGYGSLRRFLQAVERSDKFLVIERVALAEGGEGGALLDLNITLATYFDIPEANREPPRRGRAPQTRA